LHWEIDPQVIAATLPDGLSVDTYEGRTFVGLVPFAMQAVRPWWLPAQLSFRFLETNVRTYVVSPTGEPGVYFYSLDAASRLAVWAARTAWRLPYFYADMTERRGADDIGADNITDYRVARRASPAQLAVRYRVGEPLGQSRLGSLEHFLLERYLLFTPCRGQLLRGQVHHAPYPAHRACLLDYSSNLITTAGLPVGGNHPDHVHYSPGVDVEIFGLSPIAARG
jgi:uncharacterized protein YqjF (DUF2071 family)